MVKSRRGCEKGEQQQESRQGGKTMQVLLCETASEGARSGGDVTGHVGGCE